MSPLICRLDYHTSTSCIHLRVGIYCSSGIINVLAGYLKKV